MHVIYFIGYNRYLYMSVCIDLLYLVVAVRFSVVGNLGYPQCFCYYRFWCMEHPCAYILCTYASISGTDSQKWNGYLVCTFQLGPAKLCSKKVVFILNWQFFNILKVKVIHFRIRWLRNGLFLQQLSHGLLRLDKGI